MLPQPVYKDDWCELYLGDSNDILWELPNHFADAVVTDPPYAIGANIMSWQQAIDGRNVIEDIHDNEFGSGFNFEMLDILLAKLVKPNMIFFHNQEQMPDYISYCKKKDLNWKMLEWHKPGAFQVANLFLFDTEFIIHMFKGLSHLNKRLAIPSYIIEPVVHHTTLDYHPTEKPLPVIYPLVNQITNKGDIAIDPFLGSGTTAVCCKMLGRKCIGIEIKEKYMMMAIDRIKHTEANQIQAGMFGL